MNVALSENHIDTLQNRFDVAASLHGCYRCRVVLTVLAVLAILLVVYSWKETRMEQL